MNNYTETNSKSPLIVIMVGAGLLVLAAILYLVYSSNRTTVTNNPVQAKVPLTDAEVPRISPSEAKAAFDSGSALFVDTRDLEAYNHSHIPEAILLPSSEVESNLDELDPSIQVITYCT